jgi:hypothetical protein
MTDAPKAAPTLACWKCGAVPAEKLPLRREARCACGADLHCCRQCLHFEPQWRQGCREPRAEEPRTRDGANFCDWFKPKLGLAPGAAAGPASGARDALADLFKK